MAEAVLFAIFALAAVICSLVMITRWRPVYSAIAFLGTLVSLAALFFLLAAPFVAVLQIIIYAGAILVLFLFVIMLLHAHAGEGPTVKLRFQRPLAYLLTLALLAGFIYLFWRSDLGSAAAPPRGMGTAEAVGTTLFSHYILPFEVASVLLLIGLLGAVTLTRREQPGQGDRRDEGRTS